MKNIKRTLAVLSLLAAMPAHADPATQDGKLPSCFSQPLPIVASLSAAFAPVNSADGTPDANFLRITSCTDVYSSTLTEEAFKGKASNVITVSSKPCPKSKTLFDCVQDEPLGFMVIHHYEVPNAKDDPKARDYNQARRNKGCPAPLWRQCKK